MLSFLSSLWFTGVYQPVFNALILVYSTIADHNLGWAVIWLTIFLRIVLLPLTIISERNALRHEKALEETKKAMEAYKNDRIAQKNAARKIIRKYKISPWAKVASLAVQAIMLVLLYQVFLQGITGDKIIKVLYPSIDFPGRINTNFYGFEIGRAHDLLWSGIAAGYLFLSIFIEQRGKKVKEKGDLYFQVFFPLATFIVLWYLPMVKSLFILTTMVFSDIIGVIGHFLFKKKKDDHGHAPAHH